MSLLCLAHMKVPAKPQQHIGTQSHADKSSSSIDIYN